MWRADSLERTLMLGKIEDRRRRGWQRMRWLDGSIHTMDMGWNKLLEIEEDKKLWCAAVHGVAKSQTWLRDWTTTMLPPSIYENLLNEQSMISNITPMSSVQFSSMLDLDLLFIASCSLFTIITLCLYYRSLLFGLHPITLEDCFQSNLNSCLT